MLYLSEMASKPIVVLAIRSDLIETGDKSLPATKNLLANSNPPHLDINDFYLLILTPKLSRI